MSPILIVDYNPEWPALYQRERDRILPVINPLVKAVEHVGSTSVPGLGAKPIVDIMVGLYDESMLDSTVEPVVALGYTYYKRYEKDMPFRRHFSIGPPESSQKYNLHIVPYGHDFWMRHLLFRDYLRAHPEAAAAYEAFKRDLAPHYENSNEYSDAKTEFILSIEALAQDESERLRRG